MIDPTQILPVSPTLVAWVRTVGSLSIIILPIIASSPPLRPVRRILTSRLSDIVTLRSLLPPEPSSKQQREKARQYQVQIWRQLVLVGLAVIELGVWMAIVGMGLGRAISGEESVTTVVLAAGMVLVWVSEILYIDYLST